MALAALLIAGPAGAQAPGSAESPASQGVLRSGDVLRIEVWRRPEFSGEFPVAGDGSISHPLFREITAAGVPIPVVEDRVRALLGRFETNPAFVVTPLVRVIVAGEVRTPNVYLTPLGSTVPQLVAIAGGPSDRGRLDRVHVRRDGRDTTLDLTAASAEAQSLMVRSGDQILVERRSSVLRDVVAPSASIIGAIAALTSIIVR